MPIYFMFFCIPRRARLRLELWGGGALERKPHLVKWTNVCLGKRKSGLGVRIFSTLNKALLCKWSWWFVGERRALWKHVICGKYGRSKEVRESYGVALWKSIRND